MKEIHYCGNCYRFKGNTGHPQRYMCACHKREDEEVYKDAIACDIYWDCEEQLKEEREHQRKQDEKMARLHEETKNNPPVKLKFVPSYDYKTDSIIPNGEPECPYCGEMPYSYEECVFCGTKFIQDDSETQKYVEDNTGSQEEIGECMSCGQNTMHIMKYKRNGKWETGGGHCDSCGMRFIV